MQEAAAHSQDRSQQSEGDDPRNKPIETPVTPIDPTVDPAKAATATGKPPHYGDPQGGGGNNQ